MTAVAVAALLDTVMGEPPVSAHPVAWTGRYLDRAARVVPAAPPGWATATGGAAWLLGAAASLLAARAIERAAASASDPVRAVVLGVALWPLGSARLLFNEVGSVGEALDRDIGAGRLALARIVSRDTTALSRTEVLSGGIESLAENLSDSVVAPLFWFVVGGLPGAALYRYANTADACWGYRTARWRDAGLVAARVDDLLNLVPARITAGLITRPSARLRVEARRTSSPNAGWPMAAMALRLDVRLAKRDHHELNPAGEVPESRHLVEALRLARRAAAVATLLALVAELFCRRPREGAR